MGIPTLNLIQWYSLSLLHELTDGKIDLGSIWVKQHIDEELQLELKKGLIYVYDFFTSLNVLLISEAAKAEKTWKELLDRKKNPFDMEVIKNIIYPMLTLKRGTKRKKILLRT